MTLSVLASGVAAATDVTLHVLDQNGVVIEGSSFRVDGAVVAQNQVVALTEGQHTVTIYPGINGVAGSAALYRVETVAIAGSTQNIDFVWQTAPLTLMLFEEGTNTPLQGTNFGVTNGVTYYATGVPNGATMMLPVTDGPGTLGVVAGGYTIRTFPGINGTTGTANLWRQETPQQLTFAGLARNYTWKMAPLTMTLYEEGTTNLLQGTIFGVTNGSNYYATGVPNGATMMLPVTDGPGTLGVVAGGYTIRTFPGINGTTGTANLWRQETPQQLTFAGLALNYTWKMAPLTMTLYEENTTNLLQGTIFGVTNGSNYYATGVPNGATMMLPVTYDTDHNVIVGGVAAGYTIRTFPGINGTTGTANLWRQETPQQLTFAGLALNYTWKMAPLTMTLYEEGTTTPLQGTVFAVTNGGGKYYAKGIQNGSSLILPVTSEPGQSIFGVLAAGYRVWTFPGINGTIGTASLWREELLQPLTSGGAIANYSWKLATLQMTLFEEGTTTPLQGTIFAVTNGSIYFAKGIPNGGSIRLPVTSDPDHPNIFGLKDGYRVWTFPGINGTIGTASLWRQEPPAGLTASSVPFEFFWKTAAGPLHVVKQYGTYEYVAIGSSIYQQKLLNTIPTGTYVNLPLNDSTLYTNLWGLYATGYTDVYIQPAAGDAFAGPFTFEVLDGASLNPPMSGFVIDPPYVNIGGSNYGLRFNMQPVVDIDNDLYPVPVDCDDSNPNINPGAVEVAGDSIDQDCDGVLPGVPLIYGSTVTITAPAGISDVSTGPVLGSTSGLSVNFYTGSISYTVPSPYGEAAVGLAFTANPTIDQLYAARAMMVVKDRGTGVLNLNPYSPDNDLVPECSATVAADCWVYLGAGTNALRIILTDNGRFDLNALAGVITDPIAIASIANQPPVANAGEDVGVYAGEIVMLDGSASSDADGDPIAGYTWNIVSAPTDSIAALTSTNTVRTELIPDLPGQYIVSLTVSDGQDLSAADTVFITAEMNQPPVVSAVAGPTAGLAPLTVNFDASGSYDPEGGALSYSWAFGDGTTDVTAAPSHVYNSAGQFIAILTVTDDFGNATEASVNIAVSAPNLPPSAAPSGDPVRGTAPLEVRFMANASDPENDALTYVWDFGDGSQTSTAANPDHTYFAPGTYQARVTVSDSARSASGVVTVSVDSALSIDVTEAKIDFGGEGKVADKVSAKCGFTFLGALSPTENVKVVFDGVSIADVPFGSFEAEPDEPGEYEYEEKNLNLKINFRTGELKVSRHKMILAGVDNSNGVDIVIHFGASSDTGHFAMEEKGERHGDDERKLSYKKK